MLHSFSVPMAPKSLRSALVEANAFRLRRMYMLTSIYGSAGPFSDVINFHREIKHQERYIQGYGVPETHIGVLRYAARRTYPDKMLECPLGDDF